MKDSTTDYPIKIYLHTSWRSLVTREFFKEDHHRVKEGSPKWRAMLHKVMM